MHESNISALAAIPVGLASGEDELLPKVATGDEGIALADGLTERDQHALTVHSPRHEIGVPRESRVHGIVRQLQAEDVVGRVGWARTHL